MDEAAVLDAPTEDVELDANVDDSVDSTDDYAASDASTQDANVDDSQDDDSAPVISDANGSLKLSEKARAELDRIKAENPRLAREMRAALFDRQMLLNKVPGGVKEALATIEAYEAEGGSEAVQTMRGELDAWKGLDADFQKADPKFVADIAEGNPEAFVKLGPAVMDKLSEMAPEMFDHHISKIFAQDMAANDFALNLRLMQREINLLPEANRGEIIKLWTALARYHDRVQGIAKTAPKAEAVKTATGDQKATDGLTEREQALVRQEFNAERTKALNTVVEGEFKKHLGNRKASSEQVAAIQELFDTRLDKRLRADKNHTAKVDRFFAAGDRAGYAKHMAAMYRQHAPVVMEAAFKTVMPGKPGPVTGQKKVVSANTNGKTATQTAAGFARTANKPNFNDVNWEATRAVRRKPEDTGKFIMRNGEKLLYQR